MEHESHSIAADSSVGNFFSEAGFMPHGHCYLWKPELVWTHVISDLLIGLAYLGVSLTLYTLIRKIKIPFSAVVLWFGVFIGACGVTHFMGIWNLWFPNYWLSAGVKVVTAIASVGTGVYLFRLRHKIVHFAELAKLSEQRRVDLELLTKSLESRVAERTSELQHALRLRDDFLSIAAHELRTPISGLRLQLQIVSKRLSKKDPAILTAEGLTDVLSVCNRQVLQLSHLIEDMLDVSRLSAGQINMQLLAVNFSDLTKAVSASMSNQYEASAVQFSPHIEPDIFIQGDPNRMEQVISNLLTNALKYGEGKPVEIRLKKEGSSAVLTVEDQGMGIAAEHLPKMFQRFERAIAHNNISGLGLGLYISRQIVEAHNGKIGVVSELGKGSVFEVRLPLYQP